MARSDGRPVTRRIDATTPQRDTDDVRRYLEITPAEASPHPGDVRQGFERLHHLLQAEPERGLFGRLRGSAEPTTLEWLIVSDGGACRPIRYLVGTTDDTPLDSVATPLRSVFPTSYELDRVECHPRTLLATHQRSHTSGANRAGPTDHPYVAGVEFRGEYDHPLDWQTRLQPYGGEPPAKQSTPDRQPSYRRGPRNPRQPSDTHEAPDETPLTGLLETMATAEFPMLYQVLLRPKPDWTAALEGRITRVRERRDTVFGRLWTEYVEGYETSPEEYTYSRTEERRLAELEAKDARQSFAVTARAAVVAPSEYWEDPRPVHVAARELAAALAPLGQTTVDVTGRIRRDETFHAGTRPPGRRVLESIVERDHAAAPPTAREKYYLPGSNGDAFVADVAEAPGFCVLDGDALPASAHRAVAPRHSERTAIVPPPKRVLDHFRGAGMYLGHVKDQDGTRDPERLVLPPSEQNTHTLVNGKSGAGKSVLGQTAHTANHAATDGATIVIDRKGDGFVDEFLRVHYAMYGDLEDVLLFDASRFVPAFSVLDVRPDVAAGRSRRAAVEERANYFAEILAMLMADDQYDEAKVSPHVLKFLLKAAFDPVHGDDVVGFDAFLSHLDRLHHQRETPPTVYEAVDSGLSNIAGNASTSFEDVMQGAATRIFQLLQHHQLYRIFNHAPADRADPETPLFSFDDLLDEDVVIVFDVSGLRAAGQSAFTGLVFAQLWAALKRRAERDGTTTTASDLGFGDGTDTQTDTGAAAEAAIAGDDAVGADSNTDRSDAAGGWPLVNLYLEEAADVAATEMVQEFLQKARGFDCGVTLSMQFPGQVKDSDTGAYAELLNEVSTVLTGNVGDDPGLARRFATDAMPADAVANRLRALEKGEWLASLPDPWGEGHTRPFLVESAPLQDGHPDGPDPLSGPEDTLYRSALERCLDRTADEYGLSVAQPTADTTPDTAQPENSDAAVDLEFDLDAGVPAQLLQSALPYTNRLPEVVEYNQTAHALVCQGCESRQPATSDGMQRAITCCNSLEVVDRDDVPICAVPLTLTAEECAASPYSVQQLLFLQAVFTAHLGRYDPDLEYDLQGDSMLRLQEYLDVDSDAIAELREAGLLNRDGDRPHRLYTVTTDGLKLIQAERREDVTHGDGIGDLGESSLHRLLTLDSADFLQQQFVEPGDAPGSEVRLYYESDGYRYDAVVLDEAGEIVAAVEAERVNHDVRAAVPEDYDKLAAADPTEAIWVVENREAAHTVLEALNEPKDNDQRVEKTYSENTAPQLFNIEEPGCTDIHTVGYLRNTLLDD